MVLTEYVLKIPAVGDAVSTDETIAEIETDKVGCLCHSIQ